MSIINVTRSSMPSYEEYCDEIKDNIVERDLWIESNTEVGGFSGANEAIGTLVLRFDTQEQLDEVLTNQSKYVKVVLK
jgi:hypothetical protein